MRTRDKGTPVARTVRRYVDLSFDHPFSLLAIFLAVGAAAAWVAVDGLKVTTDLGSLLPEGTVSVSALDESKERIGSTDFFVIAIESKERDREAIARLQDTLAERIGEEWEDAAWVQVGRNTEFFERHALYYFSKGELEELHGIIEGELTRQMADSVPGMVNLLDDEDHASMGGGFEAELRAWASPQRVRAMGLPPQIEQELLSFFSKEAGAAGGERGAAEGGSGAEDRLIGPLNDVGVVLVQLERPSTDMDYARRSLERGEALIARVDPSTISDGLSAQVVGAYRSFMEVDSVSKDGKLATTVSVGFVLLLLLGFFRSVRAMLVIFLPLGVAGAVTMAVTSMTYGRLTVLTVFVLAMLAGMGIDYGIHLVGRVTQEIRHGADPRTATARALDRAGGALIAAASTTIASLLALLAGHFEGFKEFGIVASYGLAVCVLATLVMAPPLIAASERLRRRSRRTSPAGRATKSGVNPVASAIARRAGILFAGGVLIGAVLAFGATGVRFENDFRNLRGPRTGATIRYGRAIGKNSSTTPSVILGKDRRQMAAAHEYFMAHLEDPTISSFITLRTFVPALDRQEGRAEVIARIGELASKRAMDRVKGEGKRWVEELRRMTSARPFDENDLPAWAARIVTERNGSIGEIGHLYANVKDWNADSVREFKNRYSGLEIDGRPLAIANSAFILADVVEMVRRDGGRLLLVVSIVIAGILLAYSRSVRGALVMLLGVGCSALWTAGMMGLFGLKVGLYNVIVIPVVLGVSIDTAIHIYHRHLELGGAGLGRNLATTGAMVTLSSWTTVCGFTGLLLVSHLGLRTIGQLACVGVASSWLSMAMLLPFLLKTFVPAGKARDVSGPAEGAATVL